MTKAVLVATEFVLVVTALACAVVDVRRALVVAATWAVEVEAPDRVTTLAAAVDVDLANVEVVTVLAEVVDAKAEVVAASAALPAVDCAATVVVDTLLVLVATLLAEVEVDTAARDVAAAKADVVVATGRVAHGPASVIANELLLPHVFDKV